MNSKEQNTFDALCKVVVYHQADCYVKAGAATQQLIREGIMSSVDDHEKAYDKYVEMLVDYAKDRLPDGWDVTHDYWGAKCLAHNPGWNAPKSGTLFAGDKSGYIMFFDSFGALKEYTAEKVAELGHLENEKAQRQLQEAY